MQLERLKLLRLQSDGDLRLVEFLFFRLEGETVDRELLAYRPVLLQHDLLVLLESVQLVLGLGGRLGEDLL